MGNEQISPVDSKGGLTDRLAVKGYLKFIYWMNFCVRGIAGGMLVLMSILVFLSVVSRFAVNISLSWVEEGATYLMVWIVFFGASLAIRARHMISVEVLVMNLNKKGWIIVKTIVAFVSLAFLIILIKAGWDMAKLASLQVSPTLTFLKMFWVFVSISVGSVLMTLNMIANLIEMWTGMEAREE